MTAAICQGKPSEVADCFCEDGVYHDVFYGEFVGRKSIIDLVENKAFIYKDDLGKDIEETEVPSDMVDLVSDGDLN